LPAWVYALFEPGAASAAVPAGDAPPRFGIQGVYPNPFNSAARIRCETDRAADTQLSVFDSTGREVLRRNIGRTEPGPREITIGAGGLPSGIYIGRLTAGNRSSLCRMALIR
ncbi:MAG: T9SS type A sorting domain-containing protein, partial [bacterium]|nr:T9SS type A sorting domain-containing protein [bacterium]